MPFARQVFGSRGPRRAAAHHHHIEGFIGLRGSGVGAARGILMRMTSGVLAVARASTAGTGLAAGCAKAPVCRVTSSRAAMAQRCKAKNADLRKAIMIDLK